MVDYYYCVVDGRCVNHFNVVSSANQKDVSDVQNSIVEQSRHYNNIMLDKLGHSHDDNYLSSALIDSYFIIRDMASSSKDCSMFDMRLSYAWLDEMNCFSDRDQISLPCALSTMNVIEKLD